jgi:hypothetical protein
MPPYAHGQDSVEKMNHAWDVLNQKCPRYVWKVVLDKTYESDYKSYKISFELK